MTVHQDTLGFSGGMEEEAPELAYNAVRADSLVMFGAAVGGAILGMLLTLLILAVINGGTLSFSGGAKQINSFEANLQRINENVGAVSGNVDILASEITAIEEDLSSVSATLTSIQNDQIGDISDALATLETTQQRFDIFVDTLSDALSGMRDLSGATE